MFCCFFWENLDYATLGLKLIRCTTQKCFLICTDTRNSRNWRCFIRVYDGNFRCDKDYNEGNLISCRVYNIIRTSEKNISYDGKAWRSPVV